MTRILTLALMVSAVALTACSGSGTGKTYPAPYAADRTAGGPVTHSGGGDAVFEQKMSK